MDCGTGRMNAQRESLGVAVILVEDLKVLTMEMVRSGWNDPIGFPKKHEHYLQGAYNVTEETTYHYHRNCTIQK